MTLLIWLIFLLKFLFMSLTVLLFWIYLFLLMLVFVPLSLSLHWEILIIILSQFHLTSLQTQKGMPPLISPLITILVLIGMVFMMIWVDIVTSAAVTELCWWFQIGIDVYIPHSKYQLKPHSSPWFSTACDAAIVDRNHFFCCTNRINLLHLNRSLVRLINVAKGFLKLPNLLMLIKQKTSTSQKLVSSNSTYDYSTCGLCYDHVMHLFWNKFSIYEDCLDVKELLA